MEVAVANDATNPGGAFDLKKLRRLIELMDQHDLSEVDLREGEMRIRLRRPNANPYVLTQAPAAVAHAPQLSQAETVADAPASSSKEKLVDVTSPMVGTFYSASSPDAEPYVRVGSHLGPETTVCIIEAMKVFNEIEAEVSGEVVEVLVQNGEAVEFGQPLFRVRPSS
jgi:acetyl-CoA carboxylase biotin carboxyl carrier protein